MRGNPFSYCPACAHPGPDFRDEKQLVCLNCGMELFMNVAAAVGALIQREDGKILWVVRAREPGMGLLDVPGGFVDPGESLEQALCRECREELGTNIHSLKFFVSQSNRYLYKGIEYVTADAFFFAKMESPARPEKDEITQILWARPSELKAEEMAFDSLKGLLEALKIAGR